MVTAAAARPWQVLDSGSRYVSWSPDGTWIASLNQDPGDSRQGLSTLVAVPTLDLGVEVEVAGLRCGKCGVWRCARPHAVWYRKRVTDLSTGDVFEKLPIQRVIFRADRG